MIHSIEFLLIASSTPRTERLTAESAQKLRDAAYVERYQECGWSCATGFDSQNRVTVMVHANSKAELDVALGLKPAGDPYHG
jgi:hypothetical protein